MGYLEYVPPDQNLKADLEKVKEVGNGMAPQAGMSEKAMKVREVLNKWEHKCHKAFIAKCVEIIDHAIPPAVLGTEPKLPDEKAFDLENTEQVNQYVVAVKKAWLALTEFYRNIDLYKTKAIPSVSPEDRFMRMTVLINTLITTLTALPFRELEIMGKKYRVYDSGIWKGHMVVRADTPIAERKFKELSFPNAPISMARWVYHDNIPGGDKEASKTAAPKVETPKPEAPKTPAPAKTKTKTAKAKK
jgi:hypothetical protein